MQAFPHHYVISATAEPDGEVALHGHTLPRLASLPPEGIRRSRRPVVA